MTNAATRRTVLAHVVLALAMVALAGCGEQRAATDPGDRERSLRASASCSAHADQAAAQRAADTRDPDRDGRYGESLPCPCAGPGSGSTTPPEPAQSKPRPCIRPRDVQPIGFSVTKFPRIRAHMLAAIRWGWPAVLVLNRSGADERRRQLLQRIPTRPGHDRDEYPPAVGRGRGTSLMRGEQPRGWKADVAYVPSGENRGHGSVLGIKLRRFCDGTRFRYVFY